jgi:hypothetical protein
LRLNRRSFKNQVTKLKEKEENIECMFHMRQGGRKSTYFEWRMRIYLIADWLRV